MKIATRCSELSVPCRPPTPAQAHCSVCHRTFGGVYGFDRHRRDGRCLDPLTLGMIKRDGIWRAEMTERKRAQLARLTQRTGGEQ